MQQKWLSEKTLYDGKQLSPLFNYLNHGLLGDSCVAWQGPCEVVTEHMIDGEDLRADAKICSENMLHFVIEIFDWPLRAAILLQRIIAQKVCEEINKTQAPETRVLRRGDDIYWQEKKLNISIATKSTNSVLVHFAVNTTNEGTPVPTCALPDFSIDVEPFAKTMLEFVVAEAKEVNRASKKVRTF